MAKLSKKEKKLLKKKQKKKQQEVDSYKPEYISFISVIKSNFLILIFLVLLAAGIYSNTLNNQLTLVDDIQGFVQNEEIRDLNLMLQRADLQKIIYSIFYQNFEYSPLPLRIYSISLHVLVTLLVFITFYLLFGRKIALISSVVFALHPANTEAVSWISGNPYLVGGLMQFIQFILFYYYRSTGKNTYLFVAVVLYTIGLRVLFTPWLFVIPIALILFDQLLLSKKIDFRKLGWVFLYLFVTSFYVASTFGRAFENRMVVRDGTKGNRVAINQQSLTPVIQGWPYSMLAMSQAYVFPKDLTLYYDGKKITNIFYISMYVYFFIYVGAFFYFFKKNKKVAAVLAFLPVLVAPTLSPIKVTWFIAERYLYIGTAFFALLIAYLYEYVEEKLEDKNYILYFLFGIYISLLGVRTYMRNFDWYDTKTLSLANIKVAPYSVRAYNDLGSYYYYNNNVKEAAKWYEKGLEVYPASGTGMNNLGLIYFQYGPLVFWEDQPEVEQNKELANVYFLNAQKWLKENEGRAASFLLNKAIVLDKTNTEIINYTADYYLSLNLPEYAKQLFELTLEVDPTNQHALTVLEQLN